MLIVVRFDIRFNNYIGEPQNPTTSEIPQPPVRNAHGGVADEASWHASLLRKCQPHKHTICGQQEHHAIAQHWRQHTAGR